MAKYKVGDKLCISKKCRPSFLVGLPCEILKVEEGSLYTFYVVNVIADKSKWEPLYRGNWTVTGSDLDSMSSEISIENNINEDRGGLSYL